MSNRTDIRAFLDSAGSQIRWKRARQPLLNELEDHIIDRHNALIAEGMGADEAELQAVSEMGDPEDIGLALDRVHRPRPNRALMGASAALLACGLVLMWTLGDRGTYMNRMLIYSALGIAALWGGYFLDYTLLARLPRWCLFALCAVCMALPFLGNEFLSTSAQLCHIMPILFIPSVYRTRGGKKKDIVIMLASFLACELAAVFSHSWIFLSIYMILVCGGMVIFAAGEGWFGKRKFKALAGAFVPPAAVFVLVCSWSREAISRRLNGVLHAKDDPHAMGWLTLRVRELIGTSRFIGRGETSELLDSFIAPNELCSVDHMLAVAVHEAGWIVLVLIAALVVFIGISLIRGIRRQSSRLGRLVMLCVGLCFGLRTALYLLCNLGFNIVYSEGIPLFSYCGKLVILDMLMLGLLLSVFRTESIARDSSAATDRKATV